MGARYWPQRSSQLTGPGLPIGTKTSPSEPAKRHATQHQGTSTIIRDNNPTKPKQRQQPHLYPKGPFHTALSANIQGGGSERNMGKSCVCHTYAQRRRFLCPPPDTSPA